MLAGSAAAIAAWLSFASFSVQTGGARIALLPLGVAPLVCALLIGGLVLAAGRRAERGQRVLAAVSPLLFVALPWWPGRVPAVFLLWNGPILTLVWLAVASGFVSLVVADRRVYAPTDPRRHCTSAGVVSLLIFAAAASGAAPSIPGGDEPHYLIITQSLLSDHDLQIENNHQRGDYRAYFAGDLRPDFVQRGQNGAVYSIHAPGLPALLVPAFAIGGYRGAVAFLLVCAAAASALAWWLAWRVTASIAAAWFGWAAVSLAAPYVLETFTVYPDGVGAAVVLTGVWALLRADWEHEAQHRSWRPWLLHGVGLALLPWLHTRFSVLSALLGGLILVRLARSANPVAKAIALLSVPTFSALAWLSYFGTVYGTPDPTAPYGHQAQNAFAYFWNGLGGLLFDQGFGVLATAPVLLIAIAGLERVRRLALDLLILAAPYAVAVATFAMWWAGWSGPGRFLVPLMLPLAIPAAVAWRDARSTVRALMMVALAVSVWLTAIMAFGGGGRLGYHARNEGGPTAAPWAEYVAPLVDLPAALPAFVPLPIGTATAARDAAARSGFLTATPWLLAGAVLFALVYFRRGETEPSDLIPGLTLSAGALAMVCVTVGWSLSASERLNAPSSQLAAIRLARDPRVLLFDLTARRRLSGDAFTSTAAIEIPVRADARRRGGIANRPLAALPSIPAGEYELSVRANGGDGWIMAGIAPDQFALSTEPLAAAAAGVRLRFPLDVRGLIIRADEAARDRVQAVVLRPVHLLHPPERISDGIARRAVRYGASSVFFLDDRAFPEPSGFWVGGARSTTVVMAPDQPGSSTRVLLRNGAHENDVTLTSGGWHDQRTLQPGEERSVDVPLDAVRHAALVEIRSSEGFRPSDIDRNSRDPRFLGVFVRVE